MPDAARLASVRDAFDRFGRTEATAQHSPLYQRLCQIVVDDAKLLTLAAEAQARQPIPNLFLAALHFTLETHSDHALAGFYPSLGGVRPATEVSARDLKSFAIDHRDEIVGLLRTRLVQTNEVRRSALLLPACRFASDQADGAPLGLIEVGPSAGLNLVLDRYAYDYAGVPAGDPSSLLTLAVEVRGNAPTVSPTPVIASRYGIDLNALDLASAEDVRWLRALIWPEHGERRRVLMAAIEVARQDPPTVVSGDVFELLPSAVRAVPAAAAVVILATFVLNQFSRTMADRLRGQVLDLSHHREVRVVVIGASEWAGGAAPPDGSAEVWLITAHRGRGTAQRLASVDPHGRWLAWGPGEVSQW